MPGEKGQHLYVTHIHRVLCLTALETSEKADRSDAISMGLMEGAL